ncbi:hypothetical protein BOX15_Mlig028848g1, partial [Macrostomum lignano]
AIAMSWDSWVSNLLQYPGVNFGAICGNDGSVWAKSENFVASPEELQALAAGIGKNNAGEFQSFKLNGEKFMTIRLLNRELDAKKLQSSVTVMGCTQCFVIGGYIASSEGSGEPNMGTGGGQKVNVAVSKLKDSLVASGY